MMVEVKCLLPMGVEKDFLFRNFYWLGCLWRRPGKVLRGYVVVFEGQAACIGSRYAQCSCSAEMGRGMYNAVWKHGISGHSHKIDDRRGGMGLLCRIGDPVPWLGNGVLRDHDSTEKLRYCV